MDLKKYATYRPPERDCWKGRKSNPDLGHQYWYQQIELVDIHSLKAQVKNQSDINIALLGYVCDEGVRRNGGRIGAREGPKALREKLAKLPVHFDHKHVMDVGDVCCVDGDMEACQAMFSNLISDLIQHYIFPIAIGGGHDISYGHFMGIWDAVKNISKRRIGIINLDAHFDIRPVENRGNSGTSFSQILSEFKTKGEEIDYCAVGIQQQSNTRELFDIAEKEGVYYSLCYGYESSNEEFEALKNKLYPIIANNDYLYVTVDMDVFSSAYAPGVSAPSPLGFTPGFVFKVLRFLFETNKIISLDIAELNPSLDRDGMTANLAARMVDFMINSVRGKYPR